MALFVQTTGKARLAIGFGLVAVIAVVWAASQSLDVDASAAAGTIAPAQRYVDVQMQAGDVLRPGQDAAQGDGNTSVTASRVQDNTTQAHNDDLRSALQDGLDEAMQPELSSQAVSDRLADGMNMMDGLNDGLQNDLNDGLQDGLRDAMQDGLSDVMGDRGERDSGTPGCQDGGTCIF